MWEKNFKEKNGQLIELIMMNLWTPYSVFYSMFSASWTSRKDEGEDYFCHPFYGLLIRAHEKSLDEGKLEFRQQAHLIKGKGQRNYKERGPQCN